MLTIWFEPTIPENIVTDVQALDYALQYWHSKPHVKEFNLTISICQEILLTAFRVLIKRKEIPHDMIEVKWTVGNPLRHEVQTSGFDKNGRFLHDCPPSVMEKFLVELLT